MKHRNTAGRPNDNQRPRNVQEKGHDTYHRSAKPNQPTECKTCGAAFHGGRWYWGKAPVGPLKVGMCPACERIRDKYPAGTLTIPAEFFEFRDEIRSLIDRAEAAEKPEHPMERLMDVVETPSAIIVTTTGVHLARGIASKLERRFHRKARIEYPPDEHRIVVTWEANATAD